jgi:uncharacterized protein YxeA
MEPNNEKEITVQKLKKNQWVKFDKQGSKFNGQIGKVMKGGKKAQIAFKFTLSLFQESYNYVQVINDARHIEAYGIVEISDPSDVPNPLSEFTISKYSTFEDGHGDSETFYAEITYKGKKVISIENDGRGGCNNYSIMASKLNDIDPLKEINSLFEKQLEAWHTEFGIEKFEDGRWFDYMTKYKKFGMTPTEFRSIEDKMFPRSNEPIKMADREVEFTPTEK